MGGASPTADADLSERVALAVPAAHLRFWLTVVLGLGLDLWSKHWAFHTLRQGGARTLIPNVLEFHTTMNPGALFGFGAGRTGLFVIASLLALALVLWMFAQCPARRWFTQIALAAILAGALGNMYDRVFVRLVPLAVGGASGPPVLFCERVDSADGARITLTEYPPTEASFARELPSAAAAKLPPEAGYVRDFIKISQKWFGGRDVWPWVFNVADMLLVGGVGILAIRLLTDHRRAAAITARAAAATDEGDSAASRPATETRANLDARAEET